MPARVGVRMQSRRSTWSKRACRRRCSRLWPRRRPRRRRVTATSPRQRTACPHPLRRSTAAAEATLSFVTTRRSRARPPPRRRASPARSYVSRSPSVCGVVLRPFFAERGPRHVHRRTASSKSRATRASRRSGAACHRPCTNMTTRLGPVHAHRPLTLGLGVSAEHVESWRCLQRACTLWPTRASARTWTVARPEQRATTRRSSPALQHAVRITKKERGTERACVRDEQHSIPRRLRLRSPEARPLSVPLRATACLPYPCVPSIPLLTSCPACPRRISRQHWWRRW